MSEFHKALVYVAVDVVLMMAGTLAVVLCEGWLRLLWVVLLAASAVAFVLDWPRLSAYLVKQGDE